MAYQRSPAPKSNSTPAASQGAAMAGGAQAGGAGNAAAVAGMGEGKGRKTNLAFGYRGSTLRGQLKRDEDDKESALDAVHKQTLEHTKDGADLTDSERLWVVTNDLVNRGHTGTKLAGMIKDFFFDDLGNSGADKITKVILDGDEVRVEFTTGAGHHLVAGAILPIIGVKPKDYQGRDTNVRGYQVANLQNLGDTGKIVSEGTFLESRAKAVLALFQLTDWYKLNGKKFGPGTPQYRVAFRDFEVELMADYLDKGTFHVLSKVQPTARGKSNEQLAQAAMDEALKWTKADFAAVAHDTIELQDEAIVQRVMAQLGHTVDVDTDAEQLRVKP